MLGDGLWEALFVFNPFVVDENPRVTNLFVAEKVGQVFFKFMRSISVASYHKITQKHNDKEDSIEGKNI